MLKMNGYVKIFKVIEEDKNNKLISFRIDNEKLLEKYKPICTKIQHFKSIELNVLPFYDDKTKIRTYINKVLVA